MKRILAFVLILPLLVAGCVEPSDKAQGETMTFSEALEIAKNSECANSGQINENPDFSQYNENTKTWWIDLDAEKEGCNPACVVNEETNTAEINWRCTGVLVE